MRKAYELAWANTALFWFVFLVSSTSGICTSYACSFDILLTFSGTNTNYLQSFRCQKFDCSYDVKWLRYPVQFRILLGWLNLKSQKNHDKHLWYKCSKHKWYEGLFLSKLYLIICGSISNFLWLLINCYKSFSSSRNITVRVVDDIAFLKSVEIRSLLLMSSQVCTLCCQEQDVQLFWSHYI